VLVFLTGGPGQPGVPFAPRLAGRLGPALRGYRLVMFDQRGTGAGALDCPAERGPAPAGEHAAGRHRAAGRLRGPGLRLSQGLHASTLCADMPMPWGGPDTPVAARPAALARAVAGLTTAQVWPFDRATAAGNGFIQTCLYWPPAPAPAAAAAPRTELPSVPVLLLAGGHDLSTPLAGARAQAALAPDGHLFVVPTAGHSVQSRAAGNPAEAELARFLG